VITDIQMPVMDGIELIRQLNKNRERVVVAVLSGHDEFAYVQAAVEYSALDYVLKPFDRDAVAKLYYKMVRKLRAKTNLDQEIASLMLRSSRIRPFIKQRFFLDLIGGNADGARIEEMRDYLNLNLSDRPLRLCLIEVDERESELRSADGQSKFCLYNILEVIGRIAGEWPFSDCFDVSSNALAVVWSPPDGARDAAELLDSLELLINELNSLYGVVLNVALSAPVAGALEAQHAYEEARAALRYKLIHGSGQIFDGARLNRGGAGYENLPDARQIVEAVWRNAPEDALRLLSGAFSEIGRDAERFGVATVNLFLQKILTDCLIILDRECGGVEELNRGMGVNCVDFRASECSRAEARAFFERLIPEICAEISRDRLNERKKIILRAKQVIAEKYGTPLGVESLANEFHFSKNYFGQMFKAETGMSVNEYLSLHRIQRAKELLLEKKYKMYQIAEMVGFSDQQYFAKVFKRIVGCMPSEYQR
jgi:two-component system response regulator YesN